MFVPRSLRLVLIATILSLLGAAAFASPVMSRAELQTPAPTGRIVVQFLPGATVADRERVAELADAALTPRVEANVLAQVADKSARRSLAVDRLARYAAIDPVAKTLTDLPRLVTRIAADPAVATAYLEPRAVPAALGFDAFTGATPSAVAAPESPRLTDDFTGQQGYLEAAPDGIDAIGVREAPGALGATVRIIDVEGGWLWTHEDLPAPFAEIGEQIDDLGWRNHGTAVVGELVGQDNGYGVTGIVPEAAIGASSIGSQSLAQALLATAAVLDVGDLVLIELHAPGPNATGEGQYGYVPMEFWPDNFDAIRALTDLGIIVIEAAGNGQQDLDDPVYQGFFSREVRDSGAIMVGATDGSALYPAWFSNHGSRVDLSGWGLNVTTTGYGDLQDGEETEWYTAVFSGTSSASPIVTGAVAALQGMAEASLSTTLDAHLARAILQQTGTAINGPPLVGARPDLVAARTLMLEAGVGMLSGTVSEAGNGDPLSGVTVHVEPDGPIAVTGGNGSYRFGLLPGDYTVGFSSYTHGSVVRTITVADDGTTVLDVALAVRPTEVIGGRVASADASLLAGANVALLGDPFDPVWTDADGRFSFAAVPAGNPHVLQAGGLPGFGGAVRELAGDAGVDASDLAILLPAVTYDFETGAQGWTPQGSLWQLGDPSATDLGPAFDGSLCWGIGLDGGGYPDAGSDLLWSPVINGPDFLGETLQLSLHYRSATEANYDGVHVVLNPGTDDEVLVPFGGYTDPVLGGLGYQPGWSGDSDSWRTAVFDLTDLLDVSGWRVAIRFGSDQYVTERGFLIDGVTLHAGTVATPVVETLPAATAARLAAFPNPFNPRVTLAWSLPRPGPVQLDVIDVRGRLVRRLLHGETVPATGQVTWDGTDRAGRAMPSGVYHVRVLGTDGQAAGERITLVR